MHIHTVTYSADPEAAQRDLAGRPHQMHAALAPPVATTLLPLHDSWCQRGPPSTQSSAHPAAS